MKVNLSQTRNLYHATTNSPAPVHYLLDRRMNQIPSVPQEIKLKIRLLKKKTYFYLQTCIPGWHNSVQSSIWPCQHQFQCLTYSNIKRLESGCIIWGKKQDLIGFAIGGWQGALSKKEITVTFFALEICLEVLEKIDLSRPCLRSSPWGVTVQDIRSDLLPINYIPVSSLMPLWLTTYNFAFNVVPFLEYVKPSIRPR